MRRVSGQRFARYSVVIPVFNRAAVLERAVASALVQSVPPNDIVVVDDGSSDDSIAVAERLATRHPSLRLVRLPRNSGAPTARNVGAQYAQTDILTFLDSDDEWLPTKAERQLEVLAACANVPSAFTRILVKQGNGDCAAELVPLRIERSELFERNSLGGTSSAMIRRTAFELAGGFSANMPSCQDWDLWLRLAKIGPLVVCQEPLTIHHLDADNRITASPGRVVDGQRRITELLRPELSGRTLARVLASHDLNVGSILIKQAGKPRAALKFILRGWLRSPSLNTSLRTAKLFAAIGISVFKPLWRS